MRFQFTATLLLTLIVTLFLTTAVLAADSRAITPRSTSSLTRRSPYLTQFSERDSSISYDVRFKRAFLKQRRRVESFCRWVWELVVREVKPSREDIFYLRIQEDTIFVSSELLLAGSELQRHLVGNRDDKNDIQNILRLVDTALSAREPSERLLMIEYLRLELLDHEARTRI